MPKAAIPVLHKTKEGRIILVKKERMKQLTGVLPRQTSLPVLHRMLMPTTAAR